MNLYWRLIVVGLILIVLVGIGPAVIAGLCAGAIIGYSTGRRDLA
jgi:hypothetical protein